MLKINLLPPEARPTTLSRVEQFHRTPLMGITVGILVALPLLLWVPVMFYRSQLQLLTAKIQTLEPKKAEVDRLQRSLQQLRAQEAAFRGVAREKDLWSKRLNTLSDVTPDGVWFTEMAFDRTKGLVLQGAAVGQGSPELSGVTRLVQDLKADAEFASALKDIQIESIKTIQEGDLELVQFTLTSALPDPTKTSK